jgi:hypothetical protein
MLNSQSMSLGCAIDFYQGLARGEIGYSDFIRRTRDFVNRVDVEAN